MGQRITARVYAAIRRIRQTLIFYRPSDMGRMLGLENGLESFECCGAQFVVFVIILELLQKKKKGLEKRWACIVL
jgi:hypothetical protein